MPNEPSYKVTEIEQEGKTTQSPMSGMAEVRKEIKGLEKGAVTGSIGDIPEKVEIEEEELSVSDEKKRDDYIDLLQNVLIPHKLGKLTSREENQERLFSKLSRLTLAELKEFVPSKYKVKVGKVDSESVPTSMRAEINMRYKNISP